jgi:hypothetical protein
MLPRSSQPDGRISRTSRGRLSGMTVCHM